MPEGPRPACALLPPRLRWPPGASAPLPLSWACLARKPLHTGSSRRPWSEFPPAPVPSPAGALRSACAVRSCRLLPPDGAAMTGTDTFAGAASPVDVCQIKVLPLSGGPLPCQLCHPCAAVSQPSLRVRRLPVCPNGGRGGTGPPKASAGGLRAGALCYVGHF